MFSSFLRLSLVNKRISAGCDEGADVPRHTRVSAVMEAGTSRSIANIRIKEDMKKEGQKAAKKRHKIEDEDDQEEVRLAQRKEPNWQVG